MADSFGIPNSIFGTFSPILPAAVGRVVMFTALLENKIWQIRSSLESTLQEEVADKSVKINLDASLAYLNKIEVSEGNAKFHTEVVECLLAVQTAMEQRNGIVHRVWTYKESKVYFGWKPVRRSNRKELDGKAEWIDSVTLDRNYFLNLQENVFRRNC